MITKLFIVFASMTDSTTNNDDSRLDEVIQKLDISSLDAVEGEEEEEEEEEEGEDGDGNGSSSKEASTSTPGHERSDTGNDKLTTPVDGSLKSGDGTVSKTKKTDRMNLLKRLMPGYSTSIKQPVVDKSFKMTKEELAQIKVDRLPQRLVVFAWSPI